MDSAAVIVGAALAGAAASPLWERWHSHLDSVRARRASCIHRWGPPKPATIGFKVWCANGCGQQEFAHADGTLCHFPCETCGRGVK